MDSGALTPFPIPLRRFEIDIGINLTDPMFRGLYHGKQAHAGVTSSYLKQLVQELFSTFLVAQH